MRASLSSDGVRSCVALAARSGLAAGRLPAGSRRAGGLEVAAAHGRRADAARSPTPKNRWWRSPASAATIATTSRRSSCGPIRSAVSRFQQDPRPGDPEFIPNEYATGVVVDRHGLILTNFHVLGEESDLYVTTVDRRVYPAKIWAADAAQRSGRACRSTPRTWCRSSSAMPSNLKKGQFVVVLGNPYAIARDGQASASWGIIANLERKAPPQVDETSPTAKARCTNTAR